MQWARCHKFSIRKIWKGIEFVCLSTMLGCNRSLKANDEKIQEFEIFPVDYEPNPFLFSDQMPVVSVAGVDNKWSEVKGIEYATTRAMELIGGINEVAKKQKSHSVEAQFGPP